MQDTAPSHTSSLLSVVALAETPVTRAMLFAAATEDAMALIGEGRVILGMSPAFAQAANDGSIVRHRNGVLAFAAEEDAALAACGRVLAGAQSPHMLTEVILIPDSNAGQKVALHIAPASPALGEALNLPIPAATVKLVRSGAGMELTAARMASVFRLTGAETRLLTCLLHGDAVSDIAQRFGTKPETLRSQLKSIFLKTRTRRQSELIGYAVSIFDTAIRVRT